MIVWVYSCQNVTLLEISCRSSYVSVLQFAYRIVVKSCLKHTGKHRCLVGPDLAILETYEQWIVRRDSGRFCQREFTLTLLFFFVVFCFCFFCFVFFYERARIQIPLHHRLVSETPFKWRFAGVPIMAQHWYWLGSFTILRGSAPVLLKKTIPGKTIPGPPVPLWISACGPRFSCFTAHSRSLVWTFQQKYQELCRILILIIKYETATTVK